jgi:hypothetical protein
MPELYAVIEELLKMPHPKLQLRKHAFSEVLQNNILFNDLWNEVVSGKVKRDEIAKPGKYTRIINDMTTPVSLIGAAFAKLIKSTMADTVIEHNGFRAIFVDSPRQSVLSDVFQKLIKPDCKGYFVYFSDDSCYSYVDSNGVVRMANLDISSCDASHGRPVFNLFESLFEGNGAEMARRLVAQLELPLTLRSPNGVDVKIGCGSWGSDGSKDKWIGEPVLYSGSVLTTTINNLANLLIFISIAEAGVGCDVAAAASAAGYIVTVDECHTYHSLQFLKHSPCMVGDEIKAYINIGVLVRSLGQCKGDLPGRKNVSIVERARNFNAAYIKCFKHGGYHPLLHILDGKFGSTDLVVDSPLYDYGDDGTRFEVPVDDICCRYGMVNSEYFELCDLMQAAQFGDCVDCSASRKMLIKDYGFSFDD